MNKANQVIASLLPICVVLLPILSLFEANPGEVWTADFLILASTLSLLSLCIVGIFFVLRKNFLQAALSTSIFLLPLSIVNESVPYHYNVTIWLFGALIALFFLFIPIKTTLLIKIQEIMFIPLVILVIFYGGSIYAAKSHIATTEVYLGEKLDQEFAYLKENQDRSFVNDSDVYFIVLDELISPATFREYYKYDNEAFFSSLSGSGFDLIRYPYSNYPWTIPSVSSMVAMDYHENWTTKKDFPQIAHHLLRYNLPAKLLETEQYTHYCIPSVYWIGNPSTGIWDDFISRAKSYGLTLSLFHSTPLSKKAREFQRYYHRIHILKQLDQITEIAKQNNKKKFVFAHLLCPHRPIVFDKDGLEIQPDSIALAEKDKDHHYYLDQATFISQAINKTLENILQTSSKPPIIVLLSDHGKFPVGISGKGKTSLPLNHLSWRLSNFMALYLPNKNVQLPDLLTPVNVLRLVLSEYYGYPLPQLENSCCFDFYNLEKKIPATSLMPFQYPPALPSDNSTPSLILP